MTTPVARYCVFLLLVGGTVGCDAVTKYMAIEMLADAPAHS